MLRLHRAHWTTAAAIAIFAAAVAIFAPNLAGYGADHTSPAGAGGAGQTDILIGTVSAQRARLADLVISIQQSKTALLQVKAQLAQRPWTSATVRSPEAVSMRAPTGADPDRRNLSLVQARAALIVRIRSLDDERAKTVTALAELRRELNQAKRRMP
jgi:hypothetical protein